MALEVASPEELRRLTGLMRPSAIKRYLDEQRIPYMVGADGWPRVLHMVLMAKLGGSMRATDREPRLRLRNG